jgi:hypothetical protein
MQRRQSYFIRQNNRESCPCLLCVVRYHTAVPFQQNGCDALCYPYIVCKFGHKMGNTRHHQQINPFLNQSRYVLCFRCRGLERICFQPEVIVCVYIARNSLHQELNLDINQVIMETEEVTQHIIPPRRNKKWSTPDRVTATTTFCGSYLWHRILKEQKLQFPATLNLLTF